MWRATGSELSVRRLTNSIRPVVVVSLLVNGESQAAIAPGTPGDQGWRWLVQEQNRSNLGQRGVVGDGTMGRLNTLSRDLRRVSCRGRSSDQPPPKGHRTWRLSSAEDRAFIGALKRSNVRGAKERRKIDRERTDNWNTNRTQCRSLNIGLRLDSPETTSAIGHGRNQAFGPIRCWQHWNTTVFEEKNAYFASLGLSA